MAHIELERDGDVAIVTICRPERRNALDHQLLVALGEAVIEGSVGARCLVVSGAESQFCAGADLTTLEDQMFTHEVRRQLDRIADLPIPTVAAIEGACMGLGLQLALACDLRVAAPDAKLGIPAARLGLMVDHWTVRRLVGATNSSVAKAVLLAAEVLSGSAALAMGLVNRVGTRPDALRWAGELAGLAPLTQRAAKIGVDLLDADRPVPPEFLEAFDAAWASEDLRLGQAAFQEKRTPQFRGR